MTFKIIPIERKQSIRISILEKLAVCFVAFLIPASALAGLIVIRLTSLSNRKGSDGHLLCCSTRKRALSTLIYGRIRAADVLSCTIEI